MATKTFSLIAVVLIAFLAINTPTVSGRPCKTLFYFSATTTTTYYPIINNPNKPHPYHYTLIFTTSRRFPNPQPSNYIWRSSEAESDSESDFPRKFSSASSSVSSSVKDRTRDIMSVVGALAFGVGCGALTAAIMYFLWALFSPRRYDFDDILSSSDDDDNDDDDVAAIKRKLGGYIAVPAKEAVVDDDVKKPAANEVA